jgi:hypothetical protein
MANAYNNAYYERQRRDINDQYARGVTENIYNKFQTQQQGNRGISDYKRKFGMQLPRFQASYGARGLAGSGVSSGVYKQSLQNYIGDYTRGLGGMQQNQQADLKQFDFQRSDMAALRKQALDDLRMERAYRRANTASNLIALQPILGG